MISPAVATAGVGPPEGGVQHQFTNGTFATAEWVSQTPRTATDTSVTAVQHPGPGGKELSVTQLVVTYDATGNPIGFTQTTVDASSGFTFTIDGAHFTSAAVYGVGLLARACNEDTGACRNTTIDVSATWSGQGAITRGTVINKDIETRSNFLYIQLERLTGATRAASATGSVGAFSYSAGEAIAPPTLGVMKTGYIFLCLDGGCEN
jgi:hypothetical protein